MEGLPTRVPSRSLQGQQGLDVIRDRGEGIPMQEMPSAADWGDCAVRYTSSAAKRGEYHWGNLEGKGSQGIETVTQDFCHADSACP